MILDLNKQEVELILSALDTHEQDQLPDEVKTEPERETAFAIVDAVREKCENCIDHGAPVDVTADELHEIREALDSHRYWDLSDPNYRNSGFVMDPGSDDPEYADAIAELDKLDDKLAGLDKDPKGFSSLRETSPKQYTRAELLVVVNEDRATRNEPPWSAEDLDDRIDTGDWDDELVESERSQG